MMFNKSILGTGLLDDSLLLHRRIIVSSFFLFLLILPVKNDLPPHLSALIPKTRAIDSNLYYSLNKIDHKACRAGGKSGVCMFVWECMKTGGQHGGMCVDGFMFGSCCTHESKEEDLSLDSSSTSILSTSPSSSSVAASSTAYISPLSKDKISSLVGSATPKPYYTRPSQRPSLLKPLVPSTTLSPRPYASPLTSYLSNFPSSSLETSPFTTFTTLEQKEDTSTPTPDKKTTQQEWNKPTLITIKPPKAPTRPTRPPKPTKPVHPALSPWWSYTNGQKKPIYPDKTSKIKSTTTTTTTTTTSTTPVPTTTTTITTTPLPTTASTKPPLTGPFTTNVHSKHVCGMQRMPPQPEGRIVNGTNARYGEFPWQTSVRRTSFFGFSSTHRCGGALLNARWVATAGHCVDDLLTSQIRLRVGEYDFSSVLEPYAYTERKAKKKVVHPNYNFFTYEYDLALVEMESPVEFQPHIQPICLPGNQDLLIGETARVTGWGRLSEHGTLPSVLQQTSVPIMSNEKCKQMFFDGGRKEHIPEIFLCAGYENGGRDSCQGDSGGPLQVKGADGHWFLAGIISWGIGCAEPNLPGVCTRISKFVPFILEHVI